MTHWSLATLYCFWCFYMVRKTIAEYEMGDTTKNKLFLPERLNQQHKFKEYSIDACGKDQKNVLSYILPHYEINHYNLAYGSHHPNHIFYIIRKLSIANKNFSVPNYTYVLHVAACLSQCESAPIHKSCTFCCTLGTNNILQITFFCSPFKIYL